VASHHKEPVPEEPALAPAGDEGTPPFATALYAYSAEEDNELSQWPSALVCMLDDASRFRRGPADPLDRLCRRVVVGRVVGWQAGPLSGQLLPAGGGMMADQSMLGHYRDLSVSKPRPTLCAIVT
jgi:hypothetical protein